jgi:hypothetical protein
MNKKILAGTLIGLGMFVASKYTAQSILKDKMKDHYDYWVEDCAFEEFCELNIEEKNKRVEAIVNKYGILDAEVKYRVFNGKTETECAVDGFATPKTLYMLLND